MGLFEILFTTTFCFVTQLQGAPDNRGTEFIIGYMENIDENMDAELFITTMRTTTVSVSVTAPRYTTAGINHQFTVTAGQVQQLFFNPKIRMSGSSFSSKAILITASDEVVIYGVNKEKYSCDAFLGLPTDVLGKQYYAITYYPPTKQCELMVVGVEDGTLVNIRIGEAVGSKYVSYGGQSYGKGDTMTVTMNRYDTLQLISKGDLSGTFIESTKPVSVFSGNKKTIISRGISSDHLVEQLTPIDTWGKKFVTVPIPLRTVGDYWRFIASESNTQITISGGYSSSFTLDAGQMVQKTIASGKYCLIQSDKPILVVQFCLSQRSSREKSDPMMMIIPPVEQFGADYTFATPKYSLGSYNNYFMFIVKESEKSGLRLDGNSFPSNTQYNAISGTEYVGGYIEVSEGSHTVRHTSPISIFGGFLYGQADYETYGFATGMRMAGINTICIPTTTVEGDGTDNDCDGLIDEELCTSENNSNDDDGDGNVDEDCAMPSPIDGVWSGWGSWGACSITCTSSGAQSGTKTRTRSCNNPAPMYDGKQCSGGSTLSASCTPNSDCPVNGDWGSWGSWGGCSVTCASGIQTRIRSCNNPTPQNGGNSCSGSGSSTKSCSKSACPVHGGWTSWANWGTCTVTCGGGTKLRSRSCTNPSPLYGGNTCAGSSSNSADCNTQNCPIHGGWTSWANWGACTVTCGGGTKLRSRSCSNPSPLYGGNTCSGSSSNSADCNTQNCLIHGGWTSWANWGTCTVTCGGGTRLRSRSCTNPSPLYGGNTCSGSSSNSTDCNTQNCAIDGGFTTWSQWSSCTVTCGGGTSDRTRSCTNPAPKYGGAACAGVTNQQRNCNDQACVIDGAWGAWTSWWACTATCGSGKQPKMRTCDDPRPANGGLPCSGFASEIRDCNIVSCPVLKTGVYKQLCPKGWFTCKSGTMTCIQKEYKCDCKNDCDDGSDENSSYAGCDASVMLSCKSGAIGLFNRTMTGMTMSVLLSWYIALQLQ